MIPKIIHHIWMGEKAIPEMNIQCANSIKQVNHNFEYRFWKDDEINSLMRTEFSEYYEAFDKLPRMIMKIDMFRYFLMYKFGGLYTDMDYMMFKPFDLLDYNIVIPCNRESATGEPLRLGNCIFASVPNHPFWKSLMDTLFTIDRNAVDYKNDNTIDENILGTGPMFVYDMWKSYSKNNNDIFIPRRKLFHPPTKNNPEYINKLKASDCYGIHMCTGLWRNNNL
jgi:mannosyltransferase OCH1-like enzyme